MNNGIYQHTGFSTSYGINPRMGFNSIPVPRPSLKNIGIMDGRIGLWKGIQGTGCTSYLEAILFSLFYMDNSMGRYIIKSGRKQMDPNLKSILRKIIKGMTTFPHCTPELYTQFFMSIWGTSSFENAKDPQYVIESILDSFGYVQEDFNRYSDASHGYVHKIEITKYECNPVEISGLLRSLHTASYGHRPVSPQPHLVNVLGPILLIQVNQKYSANNKIYPSLQLDIRGTERTTDTFQLAGIICSPDKVASNHCFTAFVRSHEDGRNVWYWFSPEGWMSSEKGIPEVKLVTVEQELHEYLNDRNFTRLSPTAKYIFEYGVFYIYYSPNDTRLHESIPNGMDVSNSTSKVNLNLRSEGITHENGKIPSTISQKPMGDVSRNFVSHYNITPAAAALVQPLHPNVNSTSRDSTSAKPCFIRIESIKTGKGFGIQHVDNSCYVDVTLFCFLFASNLFDEALFHKYSTSPDSSTRQHQTNIINCLRNISTSLRQNGRVSFQPVKYLRDEVHVLNPKLDTVKMADVDEFIQALLGKCLNLPKFIYYSIGTGNYMHQIMFSGPTVNIQSTIKDIETLFQESMVSQGLSLRECPYPALIIKMARSNGKLVRDAGVLPNLSIDIGPVLQSRGGSPTRCILHLHSVIMLKQLHYTAIVRCGLDVLSTWVHFDSIHPETFEVKQLGLELQAGEGEIRHANKFSNYYTPSLTEAVKELCLNNHVCIYVPMPTNSNEGTPI